MLPTIIYLYIVGIYFCTYYFSFSFFKSRIFVYRFLFIFQFVIKSLFFYPSFIIFRIFYENTYITFSYLATRGSCRVAYSRFCFTSRSNFEIRYFAIFRFLLVNCSFIYLELLSILLSIGLLGLTSASFVALAQIDVKKIIAYSSVAHMNFSLIGFFSHT